MQVAERIREKKVMACFRYLYEVGGRRTRFLERRESVELKKRKLFVPYACITCIVSGPDGPP